MLPIMSIALSLVVPLAAVLAANPFAVPGHGRPAAQGPAAAAEPTSPKTVVRLFNGKDLAGWKPDVPARDADPNGPPSFVVRDGKLVSLGKPEGHLVTESRYRDYRLEVEYRFPGKPGNCGVLIHASTAPRPLQDVPAVHRSADDERERGRLLGHPGRHQGQGHGDPAPPRGRREMGLHRGRRPADPEPHRRLGEAARGMEHAWSSRRAAGPSRSG